MSMMFLGRRLDADELAELLADPDSAGDVLDPDVEDENADADEVLDERTVELDQAWHGIHFLLAGTAWATSTGAGEAVLGGEDIGEDMGYGPARLLTADRVQGVAAALETLDADALRAHFDAAAMTAAEIHPDMWDEDGAVDYLLEHHVELREFYAAAAAAGDAVLLGIV